jgi:hypothetical protein
MHIATTKIIDQCKQLSKCPATIVNRHHCEPFTLVVICYRYSFDVFCILYLFN